MFTTTTIPPAHNRYVKARAFIICLLLTITGGCSKNYDGSWNIPLVYKVDIQQGNVVDQSMINKLKPGMEKSQVRFIMGTPVLIDPFHSNRWDYIFSYKKGRKDREQRHISLFFEDKKLAYIKGDVQTNYIPHATDDLKEGKSVVVPLSPRKEKGIFGRMLNKMNPWSEETPSRKDSEPVDMETHTDKEADDQPEGEMEASPPPEDESAKVDTRIEEQTDSQFEQEEVTPADLEEQTPYEQTRIKQETDSQSDQGEEEKGFFSRLFDKLKPGSGESPAYPESD